MPEAIAWITLYHPGQQASHPVPDDELVVQTFRDRGWETPADTAARVLAEANGMHGQALDQALEDAGLSKGGTVAEKQARLADHQAERVLSREQTAAFDHLVQTADPAGQADPTEDTEGEQA